MQSITYSTTITGHEHLYNFGLINMNGRMYDPLTSSFLSPDNYIQDPTSQQSFNRYAYCMYNPLRYVDPTGERCCGYDWTYYAEQVCQELMRSRYHDYLQIMEPTWERIEWLTNALLSQGNSSHGSLNNHHGCGGGNAVFALIERKPNFESICALLGIEPGQPIPKEKWTDEFIKQFQEAFFPDAPMEYVKKFIVERLDKESMFLIDGSWNEAKTAPYSQNDMFSGNSAVYFNEDLVFQSPESLFYAMGHELVHVGQIMELKGDPISNWCDGLRYVMDAYAYSWMADMGRPPKSWDKNRTYEEQWQSYKDCLNYTNFPWLNNIPHP